MHRATRAWSPADGAGRRRPRLTPCSDAGCLTFSPARSRQNRTVNMNNTPPVTSIREENTAAQAWRGGLKLPAFVMLDG